MKWVCKQHPNRVLYQENSPNQVDLVVIKTEPQFCEDCNKSYFKWECKQVP